MLTSNEVHMLKEMIDSVEAEFDLLEYDKEWYVSDVRDLIDSSKQIVYAALDIDLNPQAEWDEEDESEQP